MPRDKIALKGMVFYGYHGVAPEEQKLGQRFIVDLEMERDLSRAGLSDDPEDTVSYALVFDMVRQIMEGPSRKLLENLAETIAQQALDGYDLEAIRVIVRKPEVPMQGSILDHASVEIYRTRS